MTDNALTVIPESGAATYRLSTDAAGLSKAIVLQTAVTIQGRKYVKVEGWQAIAIAHGCAASAGNVERVEDGFKATGQVRRMDTGVVIAEAEGFVGQDEPTWFGGTTSTGKILPRRPDYAIRAMAQTRAISRACRSAFAHVVVMIDKNLSTTPAEEMQGLPENQREQWADMAADAVKDGLATDTTSQYDVNKRKAAVAAGWIVTNKTARGREDQVYSYLDMAETPDEVASILKGNAKVIADSSKPSDVAEYADNLLRYFEKKQAPVL